MRQIGQGSGWKRNVQGTGMILHRWPVAEAR
jgi:hypothetical protein